MIKQLKDCRYLLWNKLWQKCYYCIKTTKWNKSFLFTYMRGLNLWACLQNSHFTTRCFGHESQIFGVIYGISFWRIWAHGTLWNFFSMVECSKGWCSLHKQYTLYWNCILRLNEMGSCAILFPSSSLTIIFITVPDKNFRLKKSQLYSFLRYPRITFCFIIRYL